MRPDGTLFSPGSLLKTFLAADAFKAIWMTVVVLAVDVTFVKSLVLVAASAVGTGVFTVVVALIQAKDSERYHRRLSRMERRQRDLTRALGVEERYVDEISADDELH